MLNMNTIFIVFLSSVVAAVVVFVSYFDCVWLIKSIIVNKSTSPTKNTATNQQFLMPKLLYACNVYVIYLCVF